jgi:hypothetical protein
MMAIGKATFSPEMNANFTRSPWRRGGFLQDLTLLAFAASSSASWGGFVPA